MTTEPASVALRQRISLVRLAAVRDYGIVVAFVALFIVRQGLRG